MSNNPRDLKEEMEEKLMEAKVFLSEARYTNINVNGVKDKIRKAVDMKKEKNYEEAIRYSEDAIEQANIILDMYEKLKSGKKKLINLKENGHNREEIIVGLKNVKNLTDDGDYKKANEKLEKITSKIHDEFEKINKSVDEGDEIKKEIISNVPEDGITIYSLKNELETIDEEKMADIIKNLQNHGYVEIEKKGRWDVVTLTGKKYGVEEESTPDEEIEETIEIENQLEIILDDDENKILDNVWKNIFLENMDEDTVNMFGWDDKDVFFKDILFYALNTLKNSPSELIKDKLLSEFDYLRDNYSEEEIIEGLKKELNKLKD
ncbi:MAG: hypothetical protein ACOC1V_00295 [Candidatus Saliniplasma sp.]